jgi:asparagine synthetase B (glutamine-hydrolysing)
MCGINGLFYFDPLRPVQESVVDRMRRAARHRGPDDVGIYVRGNVGLGFNRLSIIDLSGGHQPMSNEDGTVWIVFNVYNFASLSDDPIFPRVSLSAPVRKLSSTPGKSTVKVALKDRGVCFLRHFR